MIFGRVGRGLRNDRLDFRGDPDNDTDTGFCFRAGMPNVLTLLFSGTPANTRIIFILPETRIPELHEGCCGIGVSVFTITQ